MFGLSGLTSTVRVLGRMTKSISSIASAPRSTESPRIIAPQKLLRFLKYTYSGPE